MAEKAVYVIIVFNAFLLIGLIGGIRWWQKKHGKLAEKSVALILTGYFSFSSLTTSLPLLQINIKVTIIIDIFFLLVFWTIGYPWIRWLYRQINSSK